MITETISRELVEVCMGGGWVGKVELPVYAENFFSYGYGNVRRNTDEVEELLTNLELNARQNGDEVCGAVMGKAVLQTYSRRQVVEDALSYLSRAAEKCVKGAAVELCVWYSARLLAKDLASFENADVGVDDCYDPSERYPRVTFPKGYPDCRRRLIYWLRKTSEDDFGCLRSAFTALTGSGIGLPSNKAEADELLDSYADAVETQGRLLYARRLIEKASGDSASRQIAEGAKIVRELAEKADLLEAWRYMLECHEKGVGPFKTNKFRRDAKAAIARLEGVAV